MCRTLQLILVVASVGLALVIVMDRGYANPGSPCVKCACRQVSMAQTAASGTRSYKWQSTDPKTGVITHYAQAFSPLYTWSSKAPFCPGGAATDTATVANIMKVDSPFDYECDDLGNVLLPIETGNGGNPYDSGNTEKIRTCQ